MAEFVLYDLPSREPCRSWSFNTLKVRTVLNYKEIPFRAEWVPYVRLQETIRATGVAPWPQPNFADFTVPVMRFPDGTVLMDSAKILPKLEELYPSPSIHLDAETNQLATEAFSRAVEPLLPYFFPLLPKRVLVEEDLAWYEADRSARFGMSMEELEKTKGAGEGPWIAAKPGFELMGKVMKEHKKDAGPFILGSEMSFGDFLFVAGARMFEVLGQDAFENYVGRVEGCMRLGRSGLGRRFERTESVNIDSGGTRNSCIGGAIVSQTHTSAVIAS